MPSANILIIEDDIAIARALEEKLRKEGFGVSVMLWGETATDVARSFHPDIVLLDLLLPKHSGLEVLHEMRNDAQLKNVPVVILSNFASDEIRKAAAKLGVAGYLVKNEATLEEVAAKIREVLERN